MEREFSPHCHVPRQHLAERRNSDFSFFVYSFSFARERERMDPPEAPKRKKFQLCENKNEIIPHSTFQIAPTRRRLRNIKSFSCRKITTRISAFGRNNPFRQRLRAATCLACRLGRRFCLRQRCPQDTRAPKGAVFRFTLFSRFNLANSRSLTSAPSGLRVAGGNLCAKRRSNDRGGSRDLGRRDRSRD